MIKNTFLTTLLCFFILTASGQCSLTEKDGFIYTHTTLSSDHQATAESMIDTGCTLCVIDSTFAKDSLLVTASEKIPINSKRDSLLTCTLDSVIFCGKIYRKVNCVIADLKGHLLKYAPDFIVGADILRDRPLKFNRESMMIEPSNGKHEKNSIILKWKDNKKYPEIPLLFIVFEAKIPGNQGKTVNFVLDTGCKGNKLPIDIPLEASGAIQRESGDVFHKLTIRDQKTYNDVNIQIDKQDFILDFFEGKSKFGLLSLDLMKGHSFVLNYRNRTMEILSR